MIIRTSRSVYVYCDWCDARVFKEDFFDALETFRRKANGRIFKKNGEWMHRCGDCRHTLGDPIRRERVRFQEDTLPVVLPSPTAAQILDRKKRRLDFDDQEVKAPVVSARKLDL